MVLNESKPDDTRIYQTAAIVTSRVDYCSAVRPMQVSCQLPFKLLPNERYPRKSADNGDNTNTYNILWFDSFP